jgi:putative FmdB family regulatory protein
MSPIEEDDIMPVYDYRCNDCEHDFVIVESLEEHEHAHPKCPKCESSNVRRVIGGVHVQTGKKS